MRLRAVEAVERRAPDASVAAYAVEDDPVVTGGKVREEFTGPHLVYTVASRSPYDAAVFLRRLSLGPASLWP